jgi:cyclophilin family peptidyl-prolyl cis-trans isomerase
MKTYLIIIISSLVFINAFCQDKTGTIVQMETSLGNIEILLYDATPKHQENFIKLVKEGFYDDQLFHRVINNFMIQGGDPNSIGSSKGEMLGVGGPGYTIPAEFVTGLYHKKGALAAARKGDAVNPSKASSGSQFYIVQGKVFTNEELNAFVRMGRHKPFTEEQIRDYTSIGGTPHLDDAYTVFGEVTKGLEVVDKIASVPVDAYNRPVEDVIYKIRIVKD